MTTQTATTTSAAQQNLADNLHQLAILLAEHPELPLLPYTTSDTTSGSLTASWYIPIDMKDHAEQKSAAAQIVRAIGGLWDKNDRRSDRFEYIQNRGDRHTGITLIVEVERAAVCERVVTGTTQVTKTVPDPAALAAVPTVEVLEDVEQVEWRCLPLLNTKGGAL